MTAAEIDSRARHARSYLRTATVVIDLGDSSDVDAISNVVGSLAVLAGIAAADAICGHALGYRSSSTSHTDAVRTLASVTDGKALASDLSRLVKAKTNVQYSPLLISGGKAADLVRYAERLVEAMDRLLA